MRTHLPLQAHAPPDLAGACPLGLALSEYHALLLYPSQLLALNAISGRVAYDIQLTGPAAAAAIGGMPLGASPSAPVRLSPDSAADGAPLLATADGLYEASYGTGAPLLLLAVSSKSMSPSQQAVLGFVGNGVLSAAFTTLLALRHRCRCCARPAACGA